MKPRVFVSSTIKDLSQVRIAVREMLQEELSYDPVMSEFYDIGYDPGKAASTSCLTDIPKCNLGVLIIGKRYGDFKEGELSVTHQEYITLCNHKIPTFVLIDEELSILHRVHTDNPRKKLKMRDMDHPKMTFEFINEVRRGQFNSAYIEFKSYRDACDKLRLQIAHYFTTLLSEKKQQANTTLDQILAETISLKKAVIDNANAAEIQRYLRATTEAMKEPSQHYRSFLQHFFSTIEQGVDQVLKHGSFEDLVKSISLKIQVINDLNPREIFTPTAEFSPIAFWTLPYPDAVNHSRQLVAGYGRLKPFTLRITKTAFENFAAMHKHIKASAG